MNIQLNIPGKYFKPRHMPNNNFAYDLSNIESEGIKYHVIKFSQHVSHEKV